MNIMSNKVKRAHKQTAGFRERAPETFSDVKNGLNDWLRKNDPRFLKASEDATRRNAEVKQRRASERENQTTI